MIKVYCETLPVMKISSLWNAKFVNLLNEIAYKNFQDYSKENRKEVGVKIH